VRPWFGQRVGSICRCIPKVDLHNNSLKFLRKQFKEKFLDQISKSMIEDYKTSRARDMKKGSETQTVSPATVNRELGTLKKILNMAVDDGLLWKSPARKVQPFPVLNENSERPAF
jgi:Phage integrase SAM-like domain